MLLKASDVGLSPLQVILAYALYNLVYSGASPFGGRLSDRYGRWRVIAAGWAVYAVTYAGMSLASANAVWSLFALYGFYMALTEGVSKALVVDCVPQDQKGTALGFLYLALGLSALSSNVITGYLWQNYGKELPFLFAAGVAVLAILIVFSSGRLRNVEV